MVALIAAAAVVAAVVLVIVLTSLGGSSPSKGKTASNAGIATAPSGHRTRPHRQTTSHQATRSPAVSPAETSVAVLNGTETTGLAHHISASLQQSGYTLATPLNGRPPGSGQVTIVQYASGHQAEAEGVAHALEVAQVQPLESSVAALAGAASVVVIVGADKATTVP